MKKATIVLFAAGLALAILLNAITWLNAFTGFEWSGTDFFFPVIFFGTFLTTLALAIIGIASKGRQRWHAILMASVVLLGFSFGYLYSLGFILAPVAILLAIVSLRKLEWTGTPKPGS